MNIENKEFLKLLNSKKLLHDYAKYRLKNIREVKRFKQKQIILARYIRLPFKNDYVMNGFYWDDTKQGSMIWGNICSLWIKKLNSIKKNKQ